MDGSLALWDLRESLDLHKQSSINNPSSQFDVIRAPTYNTGNWIASNFTNKNNIHVYLDLNQLKIFTI
jgi:hypothetical protein